MSANDRGDRGKEHPPIISDAKAGVDNFTLEKHHQLTRDRTLQKMKNGKQRQGWFLHTTIDDVDHFQQILAWTLKSRWQERNQLLREITGSFRNEK